MRRFLGVLVSLAFVTGCGTDDDDDPEPQDLELTAALAGLDAWEDLEGTSNVQWTEGEGEFTATAEIHGDEPGQVRPWHVHFNTCAAGGGIVGADRDYPRLVIGADGSASVSVTVAQELDRNASYHVNVHRADDDLGTIIMCGDLN